MKKESISCPKCGYFVYYLTTPCANCQHYEKPKNWDLGFCAIYIESNNWAVAFNGEIIEQEFASQRDAKETAESWDNEMAQQSSGLYYQPMER
jgi:RNA polymerase subunit RPABC4/transcription elongation factor Spt4